MVLMNCSSCQTERWPIDYKLCEVRSILTTLISELKFLRKGIFGPCLRNPHKNGSEVRSESHKSNAYEAIGTIEIAPKKFFTPRDIHPTIKCTKFNHLS